MTDFHTAREFAQFIKGLGFRVFVAKNDGPRGYGFFTDAAGSRVVSFSMEGTLSGNYEPPSRAAGTGWQMNDSIWSIKSRADAQRVLDATAPDFCRRYREGVPDSGFKRYATLADHLAKYGASSGYTEI